MPCACAAALDRLRFLAGGTKRPPRLVVISVDVRDLASLSKLGWRVTPHPQIATKITVRSMGRGDVTKLNNSLASRSEIHVCSSPQSAFEDLRNDHRFPILKRSRGRVAKSHQKLFGLLRFWLSFVPVALAPFTSIPKV